MRKLKNEELGRKSLDEFKKAEKKPLVLVLDNIRSLNNVGSVFRTADAFLIKAIYLCGITARPPHREIQKTALGATESVDWKYFDKVDDAINELHSENVEVLAIEQADKSIMLMEFIPDMDKEYAFILGHEVNGVSDNAIQLCDGVIEIPQYGTKHSLNISVSVGIIIWHFLTDYLKRKNNLS